MPNLEEQAALLKNQTFLDKVEIATKKVATQIVGEVQDLNKSNLHQKRHYLGHDTLANDNTKIFAKAIVSLGTIDAKSSDEDLISAIGAVWNDIAGVEQTEE